MRKISLFIFSLCAVLVFNGCKNDLEIIDEWKETMVVFGLLNQSDTAQYIKINKAYLGEGDAFQMAGYYDSINYTNQLTVTLERWKNNQLLSTHPLIRDLSLNKPPGIFAYPNQVLYKTTDAIFDDSEYRLTIINGETGKKVTAKTPLVKDFVMANPVPTQSIVNFTNPNFPFKVEWSTGPNGRLYQVAIRFFYVRKHKITGVKTQDSVDWVFPEKKANNLLGNETMKIEFMGESFYRFIGNPGNVPNDGNYYLIPGKINNSSHHLDFFIFSAGEDFATYMEVNKPSLGVLQEKPIYTNLEGGIGLFSARYTKLKAGMELGNTGNNHSLDSLYAGQYTAWQNFCTENPLSVYFCQ